MCDDLDPKEYVFKNFACVMGPYSSPTLFLKWQPKNESFSIHAVWVDPTNAIAGIYNHKVSFKKERVVNKELIFDHTPKFNSPLRPGVWKCLLFYQSTKIAETSFLILPLIFHPYNRVILNPIEVKMFNNGSLSNAKSKNSYIQLESKLKLNLDFSSLIISEINAVRHGKDLVKWIVDLANVFWRIDDVCNELENNFSCPNIIKKCNHTDWSSMIIDPKTDLDL